MEKFLSFFLSRTSRFPHVLNVWVVVRLTSTVERNSLHTHDITISISQFNLSSALSLPFWALGKTESETIKKLLFISALFAPPARSSFFDTFHCVDGDETLNGARKKFSLLCCVEVARRRCLAHSKQQSEMDENQFDEVEEAAQQQQKAF